MEPVIPFVLAGLAVLLAWVAPGLMARQKRFRRSPRAALVAWQAVSVGGILAALAAAPAALPLLLDGDDPRAHARAGRARRARQCRGPRPPALGRPQRRDPAAAGAHRPPPARRHHRARTTATGCASSSTPPPRPTASRAGSRGWCSPRGCSTRCPATSSRRWSPTRTPTCAGRHDLLLEFFAVVHHAVPGPLRSDRRSGRGAAARRGARRPGGRAPQRRGGDGPGAAHARREPRARGRARCRDDRAGAAAAAGRRTAAPALPVVAYTYAALAGTLPLLLLVAAWADRRASASGDGSGPAPPRCAPATGWRCPPCARPWPGRERGGGPIDTVPRPARRRRAVGVGPPTRRAVSSQRTRCATSSRRRRPSTTGRPSPRRGGPAGRGETVARRPRRTVDGPDRPRCTRPGRW